MDHPNPAMEGVHHDGTGASFVGAVQPNTSTYLEDSTNHETKFAQVHFPNTNLYGQQAHGQYENHGQYSNLGFAVESQTAFPQNVRSLSPAQIADFQRNSWPSQLRQGPSNPYPEARQVYGGNPSYGGTYQSPQNAEIRQSYPAPGSGNSAIPASSGAIIPTWGAQSQTHRLGGVSAPLGLAPDISRQSVFGVERAGTRPGVATPSTTTGEAPMVISRDGIPGDGWMVVDGCPHLYMGMKPESRRVVTNTPGVKPHVAGKNKNETRLLPLRKDPLPCEMLRDEVAPIMQRLGEVGKELSRAKEQLQVAHILPDVHKQLTADVERLEAEKAELEKKKKE